MSLSVNITHQTGTFCLQADTTFKNGTTAVIGPSGSGKSMLLRCIAGIITPDSGQITYQDTIWMDSEKKINLPPQKRHAGYLFQHYALFENMTVRGNIMAGMRGTKKEKYDKSKELLERFQLTQQAELRPNQLSGGQRQRTALARMLGAKPALLLLDEPFSALDTQLRASLRYEMAEVLASHGGTALLVTHDFSEAIQLCASAVVLSDGRIMEQGDCKTLWEHPQTRTCAELTGMQNFLSAPGVEQTHCLGIRPNALRPARNQDTLRWDGIVLQGLPALHGAQVMVQTPQGRLLWETQEIPPIGTAIALSADEQNIHLLRNV